ncbi:MAG: CarD family transcriptional regulator [Lachnospiraceae bacterium]|nr:CarD family transcriptional regulator [Lachnospiraceae bacterium]
MFEKKQIIYSETQGVCRVDNIVSLSASKGEKGIPYYVLRSVFDTSKVSYIPVEHHQVKLREMFTPEEAKELLGSEELSKNERLKEAVDYVLRRKESENGTAAGNT